MKIVHDGLHHKCNLCKAEFLSESGLTQHQVYKHGTGFSCDKCDKKYSNEKSLQRHIKFIHEKILTCHICNQEFVERKALAEHAKEMHNAKPYKCDECDKEYLFLLQQVSITFPYKCW